MYVQGGATPLQSVLRAATAVKTFTNFFIVDYVDFTIVGFTTENLLDL